VMRQPRDIHVVAGSVQESTEVLILFGRVREAVKENHDARGSRSVGHEDGSPTGRRHAIVTLLSQRDTIDRVVVAQCRRGMRADIGGSRRYDGGERNQEKRGAGDRLEPVLARYLSAPSAEDEPFRTRALRRAILSGEHAA
jgi:hypothetical protein